MHFSEGGITQISPKLNLYCKNQSQIKLSDLDYIGIQYFHVEKRVFSLVVPDLYLYIYKCIIAEVIFYFHLITSKVTQFT